MRQKTVFICFCLFFALTACSTMDTPGTGSASMELEPTAAQDKTAEIILTVLPTATATSAPTETPTITPTSTPIFPNVLFEEDFESNKLGWKNSPNIVAYGDGKISFDWPADNDPKKKYFGSWTLPRKAYLLKGDGMVEVTFDAPVRFSGVFFENSKTKARYAIIISYGEDVDNWKTNTPSVGLLQPMNKESPWDTLNGDIKSLIDNNNGVIQFKTVFKGEKLEIYINNQLIALRSDKTFAADRRLGINDANGDKFNVVGIKISGN